MKKLILLMSILSVNYCFAQHSSFGIKGGANVSNIWIKNNNSSDYKAGFYVGVLDHVHLTRQWAIQPELMFSSIGGKFKTGSDTYNTDLNYINLPILFQYMFGEGFRVEAGPQLGLLVSAKDKNNGNSSDVKSSFKTGDFSFPIGLGYLSPAGLGVDARWVPGLSDIQKSGLSTGNNTFQIGLFYQFPHVHVAHK